MRKIATVRNESTGKTVNIYRDTEYDQFVCKLVGSPKADYFTDDKDDAFATAHAMTARCCDPKDYL